MIVFTIVVMGVIVFAQRFSFFAVSDSKDLPPLLERGLFYVLPSVLMAMVVPGILLAEGGHLRTSVNPYLIGAAVGFAVAAWRRDSFFLILGSSVLAFAVSKLVIG